MQLIKYHSGNRFRDGHILEGAFSMIFSKINKSYVVIITISLIILYKKIYGIKNVLYIKNTGIYSQLYTQQKL